MIKGLKVLAIIPARAGSKGIPGKNIKLLAGHKPLIAYTIEAAKKSSYIDNIIVSTDGEDIAKVALEYGAEVPFMRPKKLAEDKSKTIEAIVYTINELKKMGGVYDVLVLLQPTSPFRTSDDIDKSLELFIKNDMHKGLVSVREVYDSPILIRELNGNNLTNILNVNSTIRRQDMKKYVKVNGAIYINLIDDLNMKYSLNDNKIAYVMDNKSSIDIDTYEDWAKAEVYIKGKYYE